MQYNTWSWNTVDKVSACMCMYHIPCIVCVCVCREGYMCQTQKNSTVHVGVHSHNVAHFIDAYTNNLMKNKSNNYTEHTYISNQILIESLAFIL